MSTIYLNFQVESEKAFGNVDLQVIRDILPNRTKAFPNKIIQAWMNE